MTAADIPDMNVAILAHHGFEQGNLTSMRDTLRDNGVNSAIISLVAEPIRAWHGDDMAAEFKVDQVIQNANSGEYDGLFIPDGVKSSDRLRSDEDVLEFIRESFVKVKPVVAIGHGSWLLIDAGVIRGRTVTSSRSIQTDLRNGGAKWIDKSFIEDDNLLTGRGDGNLAPVSQKFLEKLVKYRNAMPSG